MTLRTLSGTMLAVLTASTVLVEAQGLPGVFSGGAQAEQPVRMAQATTADPRVMQLEDEIRKLNGTVEELNFQILQLQEQLRKTQEDNEFRFQELEKRSDTRGKTDRATAQAPKKATDAAPGSGAQTNTGGSVEDIIQQDNGAASGPGAAPKTLGSIAVDENGNPVAAAPSAGSQAGAPKTDGTKVAALPQTSDPEELYRSAYQFILSGDYATAEAGFRDHMARFPDNERAPDVRFWLGESLIGQKKYRDAAEVLLAASKQYPAAKKAPDMMLKLGISLVGLKQNDVACATFSEVGKRYPNASAALKQRVKEERAKVSC